MVARRVPASAARKEFSAAVVLRMSVRGGRRAESGNGGRPERGDDPSQRTLRPGSGRGQIPEAKEWPQKRGGRWPVAARFLSTATVHPPGGRPECRACVPAAGELRLANSADRAWGSRRFPLGALWPSRFGRSTLGWSASVAKPS